MTRYTTAKGFLLNFMVKSRSAGHTAKRSTFRKIAYWLHLWLGLISGIIVFIVCLTGGLWVFRYEVAYFTQPYKRVDIQQKQVLPPSQILSDAQHYFRQHGDNVAVLTNINYGKSGAAVSASFTLGKKGEANLFFNPYTGQVLKDERVPDATDSFFLFVRAGHRFLWLPQKIGSPIVGSACLVFLVIIITGIIWWYPSNWNKKNREKSFTVKWNAKWKRLNIDLHNVLGFYASIFLLLLTLSGVFFTFEWVRHGIYRSLTWKAPVEVKQDDPFSDTTLTSKPSISYALDRIWLQATKKHPDFGKIILSVPDGAKEAYQVMAFFGDGTLNYNNATYFYDQSTLKLLKYLDEDDRPYNEISAGEKAYRMNFDIHTGQILGLPTKILAFMVCIIGASLPVSGTLIWYNRKWGNKKAKSPVVGV
jgi:uncharacterized iron-regulated membrane protein